MVTLDVHGITAALLCSTQPAQNHESGLALVLEGQTSKG